MQKIPVTEYIVFMYSVIKVTQYVYILYIVNVIEYTVFIDVDSRVVSILE